MSLEKPWESRWRWYLRAPGDNFVGPFKSVTETWRFRRDFGPADARIVQMPDHFFDGSLYPAESPEHRRWYVAQTM